MSAITATRYHINPQTGEPAQCRAKHSCPFSDADHHYASKGEARQAYEQLSEVLVTQIKEPASSFDPTLFSLNELQDYVNSSPENYRRVDAIIGNRASATLTLGRRLDSKNPGYNPNSDCDEKTFKSMKREYLDYRNRTADLVDACLSSPHFVPSYKPLAQRAVVGNALPSGSALANTEEWHRQRYDTVGGSDVGVLVKNDFLSEDELIFYDRLALSRSVQSKMAPPTPQQLEARAKFMASRDSAIYRGTVWEDRIRDNFARSNGRFEVYETKSQFINPNRPWQQVNFDGVLVDRKTGELGILECKTSDRPQDWQNGIPLNYRAQTLYYMNAAGVDYGMIHVAIRDGEYRTYRLRRNDPVAPGVYEGTMEDYIQTRVEPWFTSIRGQRAA